MTKHTRWGLRRLAGLALPALLVGVMAGCDLDEFLDVEDPDVVAPEGVTDPSALPVVYAGVIRDFTYAYSGTGSIGGGGDNDSQILLTGLFTDELMHSGTFPTRRRIDLRKIRTDGLHETTSNGTIADAYRNLHKARRAAERGEELYEAAEAGPSLERSVVSSVAGYSYVLFGEVYCEGVPYSELAPDGSVAHHGEPTTRDETLGYATASFDDAIDYATPLVAAAEDAIDAAEQDIAEAQEAVDDAEQAVQDAADDDALAEAEAALDEAKGDLSDAQKAKKAGEDAKEAAESVLYLAQVGKARALMNMGPDKFGDAAAAVANVPSDWEYRLEHSDNSTGENNGIYTYSLISGRYGVEDKEGSNGLNWSNDSRTPVSVDEAAAFDDDVDPFVTQRKYTGYGSSVVLADGREARLIEAEAAIHGGGDFIGAINAARAVDGLSSLTDPGNEDDRVELLFKERGHALWLTAHRLGDLRRMIRQYGYDEDEVFPTGHSDRHNDEYGTDVNFPIFVDEANNPNFTGCINRDA